MNTFSAALENGIIVVRQTAESETVAEWKKPLSEFEINHTEPTDILVDEEHFFKIFLWEWIGENVLLVYSKANYIRCYYTTEKGAYLRLIVNLNRVLSAKITSKKLTIHWLGALRNRYNLQLSKCRLHVDERNSVEFDMPLTRKLLSDEDVERRKKKFLHTFEFPTDDLIYDNAPINCRIYVSLQVNGVDVDFSLKMLEPEMEDTRNYAPPISGIFYKDHALHIRRSCKGTLTFVRRPMEPIEHNPFFRFMESPKVSQTLYDLGKSYKLKGGKKISLFFEKYSEKAEEGAYDVFLEALKNKDSLSYFIIDENSEDFKKIKNQKHVIRKYSMEYYRLLYRATSYISTDAPAHASVMRSNNYYFRKNALETNFIFLQHGITYLKCHGKNSAYLAGKEAEPKYIVVGSEKEKNVVSEMFGLPPERILNTGLPIFSKIQYKHLNQESEDIVVVMLTWKPYEEYLADFEESTYYQNTVKIAEFLHKKLSGEQIKIVAHPKTKELLEKTPLKNTLWHEPISEVLKIAKLLITDYSSVCYNSFYQGGAVIFYQEDLEFYESVNGELIPSDDEYIGYRAFDFDALKKLLNEGISEGKILLDKLRTEEFERRYATINEYSDGGNVQRICKELRRLKLI